LSDLAGQRRLSDLASQHCRPLPAGSPALSQSQIDLALEQLPGWAFEHGVIAKTFSFADYHRTIAFVNAVAWISHVEDHHPDLHVGYDRCRVEYSTHSIGGISQNDFICAARIEALQA
jgi:4a-hydroxytetrahydrobiopterin dehydratase